VLPSEQVEAREKSTLGPSFNDSGEIKQMLAGIMTVIQQSNAKLQESVKADIDSVRKDIKAENEKLIKRFELQSQGAQKEFSAKLDSEARRLINLVGQVHSETE
jgi:ABC-type hemin transport system substrate-binding protein